MTDRPQDPSVGACDPPSPPGYRIESRLAVGGMAELFSAIDERSGLRVVVKRLLPGAGEAERRLFERERNVLKAVRSPYLVELLADFEGALVLEYVPGCDLDALLRFLRKRGKQLDLDAVLWVARGILLGLQALHDASVIHRDINPSNVLVSDTGDVKLADLGVARWEPDGAGARSLPGLKGTLLYMAPEQLAGSEACRQSDLYAAALVIYELATGASARPPGMVGLTELLQARQSLPVPPSSLRPGLPKAMDRVLLRGLAPEPKNRPGSAVVFLRELVNAARVHASPRGLAPLVAQVREKTSFGARVQRTMVASSEMHEARKGERHWIRGRGWALGGAAAVVATAVTVMVLVFRSLQTPAPPARRSALKPTARLDATTATPPTNGPPAARGLELPAVPSPRRLTFTVEGLSARTGTRPEKRRDKPPSPFVTVQSVRNLSVVVRPGRHGPLHVRGAGVRGLAPQVVSLPGDAAAVLRMTGGDAAIQWVVRVQRQDGDVVVSIGGGPRSYYRVSCDGRYVGPTPVIGVALRGTLRCKVEGKGGQADFVLALKRP